MADYDYEHNVRVHKELRLMPLPVPREAWRVWEGTNDVWIEPGHVVAIGYDALSFTWDGRAEVEDRKWGKEARTYRQYTLDEGKLGEARDFWWMRYLFIGMKGEADTEPFSDSDGCIFWDAESAEQDAERRRKAIAVKAVTA